MSALSVRSLHCLFSQILLLRLPAHYLISFPFVTSKMTLCRWLLLALLLLACLIPALADGHHSKKELKRADKRIDELKDKVDELKVSWRLLSSELGSDPLRLSLTHLSSPMSFLLPSVLLTAFRAQVRG
jgi:hypothetical protein